MTFTSTGPLTYSEFESTASSLYLQAISLPNRIRKQIFATSLSAVQNLRDPENPIPFSFFSWAMLLPILLLLKPAAASLYIKLFLSCYFINLPSYKKAGDFLILILGILLGFFLNLTIH